MKLIVLFVFAIACGAVADIPDGLMKKDVVFLGDYLERIENDEVICYRNREPGQPPTGLSCKWK